MIGRFFICIISFYRKFISGLKSSPTCRFHPTCSEYGIQAIREWGALVGGIMTLYRILRCNPFCKGGYDPVPRRKRKTVPKSFGFIKKDPLLEFIRGDMRKFWKNPPFFME